MEGEFLNGVMVGAVLGMVFCCAVFLMVILLAGKSLRKSAYKCGVSDGGKMERPKEWPTPPKIKNPEGDSYEQWVP